MSAQDEFFRKAAAQEAKELEAAKAVLAKAKATEPQSRKETAESPGGSAPVTKPETGPKKSIYGRLSCLVIIVLVVLAGVSSFHSFDQKRAEENKAVAAKAEKFKEYALAHAVTHFEVDEIDGKTMFVRLTPDKYTNRDNVRLIAEQLAFAYANQVGLDWAVCHVYLGNEEYAKGTFRR